jgi:uncharacterized protein
LNDHHPTGTSVVHSIEQIVEHATHLLPAQGPIKVFVHHNTLHAFEDKTFDEGVLEGLKTYGCEPYFSEQRYRDEISRGRIRLVDLEAALLEDLGDDADRLVASFGTRYALRLAMLQFPMDSLPDRELQWMLTESDLLRIFRKQVTPQIARRVVEQTRRDFLAMPTLELNKYAQSPDEEREFPMSAMIRWSESTWQAFTLNQLWKVCSQGVQSLDHTRLKRPQPHTAHSRHRDLLASLTGADTDTLVHDLLIRFCAAFLDQGFAAWQMPDRDCGFLHSFVELYAPPMAIMPTWLYGLRKEMQRFKSNGVSAVGSIKESLELLGVPPEEYKPYLTSTLLALRGWAGMIWQMETSAPWTPRPAPSGSLLEFLAVRLVLDRYAIAHVAKTTLGICDLRSVKKFAEDRIQVHHSSSVNCVFSVFQIAQARGWSPVQLSVLSPAQWQQLVQEVLRFSSLERRRIMQHAYERTYRNAALDAILLHSNRNTRQLELPKKPPFFQVITCIDDREESFRRHLEEIVPECETFGAAGFFAVAMYYRGAAEAHYRPLCPINIVPRHYVTEEPVFSAMDENIKRSKRRRLIGQFSQQVHSGSRTMLGGLVTGLFGTIATFPLVARILAPRITSRIRDSASGFMRPPATELHLQRVAPVPGPQEAGLGYSTAEMAGIVVRILQDIGLVKNFSPIVLFLGHGSSSLNNPHESAYNCGACSGGRGGPNARAFAWMANQSEVRKLVTDAGIEIPDDVRFLGGYHNTCSDRVEYFDLDQLPRSHRTLFREMEANIGKARERNALERVRRFESTALDLSPPEALAHVEERSEDLSQARPEYNHATNAMCLVGRRQWSRGLFLDRRAFLASYDPAIDDASGKIVERILQAAIPVCGGISLEYYFSTVDPEGYGCGSKLPHNITSLAGVMTGAASDLRPGLSAQMVEIHEPLRILFVVETTPEIMARIIAANESIKLLVEGKWVQLAILDTKASTIRVYQDGNFVMYKPQNERLAQSPTSIDWFGKKREHLGFASIVGANGAASMTGLESNDEPS